MATVKSYTDIPQSKRLAEILPLESADMYYALSEDESTNMMNFGKPQGFFDKTQVVWSLAALLGVLPNPSLHKTYTGWRCDTYNENCTKCQLGDIADNPLDACYEMILKLHELNLL